MLAYLPLIRRWAKFNITNFSFLYLILMSKVIQLLIPIPYRNICRKPAEMNLFLIILFYIKNCQVDWLLLKFSLLIKSWIVFVILLQSNGGHLRLWGRKLHSGVVEAEVLVVGVDVVVVVDSVRPSDQDQVRIGLNHAGPVKS